MAKSLLVSPPMKRFAYRAIREVLFGIVTGGSAAIVIKLVVAISGKTWARLESRIPTESITSVAKGRDFEIIAVLVALCGTFLSAQTIASFFAKLYRSWSAGIVTGISLLWCLLTLWFFVAGHELTLRRSLVFGVVGLLFVLASGFVVSIQRDAAQVRITTPEPLQYAVTSNSDFKFDQPIKSWSEDRFRRGEFVQELAEQVLREKASVLAVVGSFGEGKTSTLNLLAASLAGRSEIILVRFSSWLPGDPRTLALSFFATISDQIKRQFLIFGLSARLRGLARLLAGSVPRFGDALRQLFEPSSQMEQLDSLKNSLGKLPARVVVLIDEMDRLDRAELQVLLKSIRGVVDFPNITYVCAFDKKAMARVISRRDLAYGEFYLEKFFPMRFALPAIDELLLGSVFDSELDKLCETFGLLQDEQEKKGFNEAALPLWHSATKHILTNFRKMALFFNAMRAALAPVYAEVNLFDMMVLQLVRFISEDTCDFIYGHGPVFYYPNWRVDLWLERLSVDDAQETKIRKQILGAFFETLPISTRSLVTEMLRRIFPTVSASLKDAGYAKGGQDESQAEKNKRIYHPDYFARYFIHSVQENRFGRLEMSRFIDDLNAENELELIVTRFRRFVEDLSGNYWRRLSFLDALVQDSRRLGDLQAEAMATAIPQISGSFQTDIMGLGDRGRARAALFVALNRFAGSVKLQELLARSIKESASDDFGADLLRFSTKMRPQNHIITNWHDVEEDAIVHAFAERMRGKYAVGSDQQPPYNQREDINSFLIWAGINADTHALEIEFFRDRFQRFPQDTGRFIGWLLPKHGLIYDGDPLITLEKLYPLDELLRLVQQMDKALLNDADRESVHWFIELMEKRTGR